MEKFTSATVAAVTGYSVSTVGNWAHRTGRSSKGGFTLPEICEFMDAPKHEDERGKVDDQAAQRLRVALEVMGKLQPKFELKG